VTDPSSKIVMALRCPPAGVGGVETVVREVVKNIRTSRQEWELDVIVAFPHKTVLSRVPLLGDLVAAIRIVVAVDGTWDVIVVHGAEYAWFPMLTGKLHGRPVIVVWHGVRWREAQGYLSRSRTMAIGQRVFFLAERWLQGLALRADATVAVGPSVADQLRSVYGFTGAIRVIPNGIRSPTPGAKQAANRTTFLGATSTLAVLWVGAQRQPHGKGLDIALEACAEARHLGINLVLDVVGVERAPSGSTTYRDASWITWHGPLEPTLMRDRYDNASVLLAPTRYEACSMVVLEAFAAGLPVIGSPAIAWLVGDAGICVDNWNSASYVSALMALWGSPDLRKDLQCKALARASEFNWEVASAQYVKLIEAVIAQKVSLSNKTSRQGRYDIAPQDL